MRSRHTIHKSIDIDFAHFVEGHLGACINLHGHTWKFEVGVAAAELSGGFVVDFKRVKTDVLEPAHLLFDHSLALSECVVESAIPHLRGLGQLMWSTRRGKPDDYPSWEEAAREVGELHAGGVSLRTVADLCGYKTLPPHQQLNGAASVIIGGLKIAVLPFVPTSERLAEWLFNLATQRLADDRVRVAYARVYETLHPVESVATFEGDA